MPKHSGGVNVAAVVESLWKRLPGLARELIRRAHYPPHERNDNFLRDPDDPNEHETRWHQWGIITHSRKFGQYYAEQVPGYLRRWGVDDAVGRRMAERVDGVPRDGLLRVSIPLHDLGKFAVRRLILARGDSVTVSFKRHERESGVIIRETGFTRMLQDECGLTGRQVEYVAQCAERHYELAKVRDEAKRVGTYTLSFVHSAEFGDLCRREMGKNPGFELEVGLLWLADSLAKVEVRIEADSDAELAGKDDEVRALLRRLGLREGLFNSARQMPVNVGVAEAYLKAWALGVRQPPPSGSPGA